MTTESESSTATTTDEMSVPVALLYMLAGLWILATLIALFYGSSHSITIVGFIFTLVGGVTAAAFCLFMGAVLTLLQRRDAARRD